jgi:large subunit ribosomal protein L6
MSRIGKKPVPIPSGVKVAIEGSGTPAAVLTVQGPLGRLEQRLHPLVEVEVADQQIQVRRRGDSRQCRALHGLTRALAANMCTGVTAGFSKMLEIVGTGYGARLDGNRLKLTVGYSRDLLVDIPEGLEVATPTVNLIEIKGIDKQQVGDFAARVRKLRPPEPYKGKGIRYRGEAVRRKAGKTLAGK